MLAERPDDPRIAIAFANFALEPPTTSSSNFYIWKKLFAALEKSGDARVVPILKKRLKRKPGASQFWPKLAGWIEGALKKIPAPPKLTKEEAAAVAAVVKAARTAKPATTLKAKPKAVKTNGDPLARAIAAVEANDLDACIEALLEAWRAERLEDIAYAIDRVTALHDEGLACPGGKDKDVEKAWRALAANRRAIDVGRLADASVDGKLNDVEKRLEEMLTWPEDPRIGCAMPLAFDVTHFGDRTRVWNAAADLLVRNSDARLADAVAWLEDAGGQNKARRAAARRAGPAAVKANAKVPEEPTPTQTRALEELDAALSACDNARPVTEKRLLEAILAAPKDNGPRLVYGDWLSERGHPRGELIALQFAAKPNKAKIDELYAAHPRALFGPAACLVRNMGYALSSGYAVFDRGLLQKIELRNTMPSWFAEHPLLWFIEEIEPEYDSPNSAASLVTASRSLRTLTHAQTELVVLLAQKKTPLPLETMKLTHAREVERPIAILLDGIEGPGLSNVKSLEISWSDGDVYSDGIPDRLVASPLFGKLESLAVSTTRLDLVLAALKKAKRSPKTLTFLRRYYIDCQIHVTLDKKLAPTRLDLVRVEDDEVAEMNDAEDFQPLLDALASLQLPKATKLQIGPKVKITAPLKKKLAALVSL